MRRGKVQIKRIDDKSSRQVTFSKRKGGLLKKANELSILCDVDVGIIIFSGGGRLYEYSSRDSLAEVLDRYTVHKDADASRVVDKKPEDVRRNYLLELVSRQVEDKTIEQLEQLEGQLASITRQARNRKMQLMNDSKLALQQKTNQEVQGSHQMQEEISAMINDQAFPSWQMNLFGGSRN